MTSGGVSVGSCGAEVLVGITIVCSGVTDGAIKVRVGELVRVLVGVLVGELVRVLVGVLVGELVGVVVGVSVETTVSASFKFSISITTVAGTVVRVFRTLFGVGS